MSNTQIARKQQALIKHHEKLIAKGKKVVAASVAAVRELKKAQKAVLTAIKPRAKKAKKPAKAAE